jgi:hypothetical protein
MSTEAPIVPNGATPKKINLMAIGSSITGALAYLLIFFHSLVDMSFLTAAILAPISALVAIFTGHRAKRLIRRSEETMSGKKLANAGLAMGYIYIGICILIVVLLVLGVAFVAENLGNLM